MSTDNILRAPILQLNETQPSGSGSENYINFEQLKEVIAQTVRSETQQIFDQITHANVKLRHSDQTIDPKYLNNLNDMDKIPDVVKSLREFSGQPGEFGSWKKSVERILKIYNHLKGTPKYYGIISVIRNKITGQADTALESYNTPLNWEEISKCLTLHYADKRDLGTLEYQMTTLIQKNSSIPEFYEQVYRHLSLILNKLSSMDMSQESMNVMTQAYRDKALDTFVRGLRGDLPRLLSMKGPTDLPEALHLCLKLENVQYRVQHSHSNLRNSHLAPPPLPLPRRFSPQPQRNYYNPQTRKYYPELQNNPQAPQSYPHFPPKFQSPRYSQNCVQQPPKPFNGNYLPRPEPMDVDRSMNSRQINYQNRSQINNTINNKPHYNQIPQPINFQSLHQTESFNEEPALQYYYDEMSGYDTQIQQISEESASGPQELEPSVDTDSHNAPNQQETDEQLDNVNFLD